MPVEDVADILDALGLSPAPARTKRAAAVPDGPVETALEAAGDGGLDLDGLARSTGLEPEDLLARLTSLELDGKARKLTGGRYVWIPVGRDSGIST